MTWTRHVRNAAIAALALLACGCTSQGFSTLGTATPPSGEPVYKDPKGVEEIEALEPQLELPLRLAVSQPATGGGWSREEVEVIESWAAPLRDLGVLQDLVILPESLDENHCPWNRSYFCGVRTNRANAGRFRADALLLISISTEYRGFSSPLALLNLTGVGLWVVPAHHREARTVLEGVLVDNRNEYLYAFARAYGTAKSVRPRMYAKWERAVRRARLEALEALGEKMVAEVRSAFELPKETPPKETPGIF